MALYGVCNRVFSVWLYMECVMEYSLCVTIWSVGWSIICVSLYGVCNRVFSVCHYMECVVEYSLCGSIWIV